MISTGAKILCNETDLKVRKAFVQMIIAMASKNYLVHEGGQSLVQCVVKECSIPGDEVMAFEEALRKAKKQLDPDSVSPKVYFIIGSFVHFIKCLFLFI
jgi:hypothetical protein